MKTIKGLKIASLVPLAWMIFVLLVFGIGEAVGGDWSGLGHFVPVIVVALILWLGWNRPLWGGALLLVGAALEAVQFSQALGDPQTWLPPFLIMVLPLALAGVLMLSAGLVEHRSHVSQP
jgi:hypothetical protein